MSDLYKKIVNERYIGKEVNPINQSDIFNIASAYSKKFHIKDDNNIVLLIVDAQRDFIDPKKGSLPVKGAVEDVKRIINFIYSNLEDISGIYTTIDTHYYDSIFHPYLWKKPNGEDAEPFTEVTLEKIYNHEIIPLYKKRQVQYVKSLKNNESRNLMIWPYHCIHGTDGWLIEKQLNNMLLFYERVREKNIHKIIKGTERLTEMYGAVKPEVITSETKFFNMEWVYKLKNYKHIYVCGEAKDFSVYNTLCQICDVYSNDIDTTQKINLMVNCSSSIYDNNREIEKSYSKLQKYYGINMIEV